MRAPLDQLAERCGIERGYEDLWGERRVADDDALRALLGAMGVEAWDDRVAARSVERLEAARWRRALDPVVVFREPIARVAVEVRLSAAQAGAMLHWRLVEEGGSERGGSVAGGELPRLADGTLGGEPHVALHLAFERPQSIGYHRLELRVASDAAPIATACFVMAPERCHQPASLAAGERLWGIALQTYALRSSRDWGIGDYSTLRATLEQLAALGAQVVGVQPLHALDAARPEHASPYYPSSRRFLNVLAIDVEAVEGFDAAHDVRQQVDDPAFRARLSAARAKPEVDYAAVAALKLPVLDALYRRFRRERLLPGQAADFAAFRAERGAALEGWGAFEALREWFRARDASLWGWPVWPEPYRDARSAAVRRFADEHHERVEWFLWLQWVADTQLRAVALRAEELALDVGLYRDLAVGFDGSGFDAWWDRGCFALDARYGAPPDDFSLEGQDWGLPPPIPDRLREACYEPFIAALRDNMRHAGALRIDHVMSLMRAFWVPPGRGAAAGTYVRYPFEDLLALVTLESHRQRCAVVGEDLGTVPPGLRETLQAAGLLAYRVLYFTREDAGTFSPPGSYPRGAVATISTHDLPTLPGWWTARDLVLRRELGAFPEAADYDEQIAERAADRRRLLDWLEREGRLPSGLDIDPYAPGGMTGELSDAVHACLASGPTAIFVARLEDALGQLDPVNLPGTLDGTHPNWRRKLPRSIEVSGTDPALERLARCIGRERPPRRG